MKTILLSVVYRYITLSLMIVSLGVSVLTGFYLYNRMYETIIATATLAELQPDIIITEPINFVAWNHLRSLLETKTAEKTLDLKKIHNPFTTQAKKP